MTEFSCPVCNTLYNAAPPDGIHIIAKPSPCPKNDSIPFQTDCSGCKRRNTLWWDKEHDIDEGRFNRIAGAT